MEEGAYEVIIATPAIKRYHKHILPYLHSHLSSKRAVELDERILQKAYSLTQSPSRRRAVDEFSRIDGDFKYILFRESKNFELKIIYFIRELQKEVFITDFFPIRMDPNRIGDNL